jgi:hypothetical protein
LFGLRGWKLANDGLKITFLDKGQILKKIVLFKYSVQSTSLLISLKYDKDLQVYIQISRAVERA